MEGMEERRERVLKTLHSLNEKRDRAKAVYYFAKETFEQAQIESESAVAIQHAGAMMETARNLWQSAEKDLDDFVMGEW